VGVYRLIGFFSSWYSATKKPADDVADPSGLDSGWVVLGNSDIVPADLAAADGAFAYQKRYLQIYDWPTLLSTSRRAQMVLGGVVYSAVPFYKRARKVEGVFRFISATSIYFSIIEDYYKK
jgi:hypothetical protein